MSTSTCANLRKEIEREGTITPVPALPGRRHLPLPLPRPVTPAEALDPVPVPWQERGRHPRTETPGEGALLAGPSEGPPLSPAPPAPPAAPPEVEAGLGEDFRVLAEQERDVVLLIEQARKIENYVAMERLTRTRIELRRGMAQLRPPPPVDPEADVANGEAARLLVARMRKMIKAVQGRALQ